MAFLSGYTLRKEITIDDTNVDGNLTDFPALVAFDADADIGAAIDSGGLNIRFTTSDGETLLKYERQSFSVSVGAATGRFWVKVPSILATGGGTIYLYYKGGTGVEGADPTNVWDANSKAVYHFEEDPSGSAPQILDSTAGAHHGTTSGMIAGDLVASEVGNALSLSGSKYVNVPDHADLDLTSTFTLTFIANIAVFTDVALASGSMVTKFNDAGSGGGTNIRGVRLEGTGVNQMLLTEESSNKLTVASAAVEGLHQFDIVSNASGSTLYVDGVSAGSGSRLTSWFNSNGPLRVGKPEAEFFGSGTDSSDFDIDELRLQNTDRAAAWIKFCYQNIFAADHELTFGAEESEGGGGGSELIPQLLRRRPSMVPQEPRPAFIW